MRDQWYYWSARWTYQCTLAVNGQRSQTVVKLGSTACTGLYIKYQGRCAHWIIVLMLFPEWWQAFADAIGQGSTIKYVRVPQKVSWNTAQTIFKQFLKEDYSFFISFFSWESGLFVFSSFIGMVSPWDISKQHKKTVALFFGPFCIEFESFLWGLSFAEWIWSYLKQHISPLTCGK